MAFRGESSGYGGAPDPFNITARRKRHSVKPGSDSDVPPFGLPANVYSSPSVQHAPPGMAPGPIAMPMPVTGTMPMLGQPSLPPRPVLPKIPGVRPPKASLIAEQAPYNKQSHQVIFVPNHPAAFRAPPGIPAPALAPAHQHAHARTPTRAGTRLVPTHVDGRIMLGGPASGPPSSSPASSYQHPGPPVMYGGAPGTHRTGLQHSALRSARGRDRDSEPPSRRARRRPDSVSSGHSSNGTSSWHSSSSSTSSFASSPAPAPRRRSSHHAAKRRTAAPRRPSMPRRVSSSRSKIPKNSQYAVLGVPMNAERYQIKRAYMALALKYHDIIESKRSKALVDAAEERLDRLEEAYMILGNSKTRRKYDKFLAADSDVSDLSSTPSSSSSESNRGRPSTSKKDDATDDDGPSTNAYQILGVSSGASQKEIDATFAAAMKGLTERESYAFNRAAQNEVAYMRQVVTEAYNIVKDPKLRTQYDRYLLEAMGVLKDGTPTGKAPVQAKVEKKRSSPAAKMAKFLEEKLVPSPDESSEDEDEESRSAKKGAYSRWLSEAFGGDATQYDILGLDSNASSKHIEAAYKETLAGLAETRKYDKDIKTRAMAAQYLKAVKGAYKVLRDRPTRKRYDALLLEVEIARPGEDSGKTDNLSKEIAPVEAGSVPPESVSKGKAEHGVTGDAPASSAVEAEMFAKAADGKETTVDPEPSEKKRIRRKKKRAEHDKKDEAAVELDQPSLHDASVKKEKRPRKKEKRDKAIPAETQDGEPASGNGKRRRRKKKSSGEVFDPRIKGKGKETEVNDERVD